MMKISIITPCYNAVDTLADTLRSVAAQSTETEHIVIDGGSTDGSVQLIEQHGGHLQRWLSEPDRGIYDAMNKGIELASGEIIGVLNADDFYPSAEVLSWVLEAFSRPDVDACYGDLRYVDAADTSITRRYWRAGEYQINSFYRGWMPPHPTFFVRRRVYERHGLFRLDMDTAADYELMLRFLLKHRLKAVYIPRVLVHMRTGGASNAGLWQRIRANRMDRRAWTVNDLKPYPWTLWMKPVRKLGQWWRL